MVALPARAAGIRVARADAIAAVTLGVGRLRRRRNCPWRAAIASDRGSAGIGVVALAIGYSAPGMAASFGNSRPRIW